MILRNCILLFCLSLLATYGGAQCPTLTNENLSSSFCHFDITTCDLCVGDDFDLTVDGTGLLDGDCVDWYFSNNPSFDPSAGQGTFIDCGLVSSDDPCNSCLSILAFVQHGIAAPDPQNEAIILNSGGGLNLSDLIIDFDFNNNSFNPQDADIGAGCSLMMPTIPLSGCPGAIPAGPGTYIPPNAIIVVYTSAAAAPVQNFAGVCGTGAPIYYTQNSCNRTLGAFTNNPSDSRTQIAENADCPSCQPAEVTWTGSFSNSPGDYITGNGGFGNSGNGAPPVFWSPGNPLNITIDPVNFTVTSDLCGGGPYYIRAIPNPLPTGCPPVASQVIEFEVRCPDADITGDASVCDGEDAVLTATGGTDYEWDTNDFTASITVTPFGSTTYFVTVTEGICEDYDDFTVDITPATPIFLVDEVICEDDPLLNLSFLIDPSFPNGVWSGPGVIGNQFDPFGLGGQFVNLTFDPDALCAADGMNEIEVLSNEAPFLERDTICQNNGSYDLMQLEDPFLNDGVWSGNGVINGILDPSSLSGLVTVTFTPTNQCSPATNTTILIEMGGLPQLKADTVCENSGMFDLTTLNDPNFPNGTWSGPNVSGNMLNTSGIGGNVALNFAPSGGCASNQNTFVRVVASATPVVGLDSICQSVGMYDLTQIQDINFPNGTWSGSGVTGTQFNPAGLEGTISLTFDPTDDCILDAPTQITVYEPISVTDLMLECDSTDTGYTVSFNVNGGDAPNLSVTGDAGNYAAPMFLSDTLMPGDTFQFTIWDGGKCPPIELKDAHNCSCRTFAGTLPDTTSSTPFLYCANDIITIEPDSNWVLDGSDTLIYVLHTGDSINIGTILASNNTPTFTYDNTNMALGQTYFISAVAGNKDITGVDFRDSCFSNTLGVPIQFSSIPSSFFLSGNVEVCAADSFTLQLALSGVSPFIYQISENGVPLPPDTTTRGVVDLRFRALSNTTYEIISFQDAICSGDITTSTATVTVVPLLTMSFADTIFHGNGTYSVVLDVNGGNSTNYQFTGNSGNFDGSQFTTDPIPCGTQVEVCVTGGVCSQVCYLNTFNCASPCTTFAGTLSGNQLDLCFGESQTINVTGFSSDGDDALNYILHDNAGSLLGSIIYTNQTGEVTFTSAMSFETVYYFSAVAGNDSGGGIVDITDPCLSIAPGTPIVFHDLPDATFGNDLTACRGAEVDIDVTLSGNAPFTINYDIDNFSFPPVSNINQTQTQITNIFNQPGQVIITSINDEHCQSAQTDTINVSFYPDLQVDNFNIACDPTNQNYQVTFDIQGGIPGTYQVIGDNGTISNGQFIGDPINSNGTYTYQIFDVNRCDTIELTSTHNCTCSTDAGTLQPNPRPFLVCGNELVQVIHNNDENLDGNDELLFVLHDNQGAALGTVFEINDSGRFSYLNTLTFGQTYYISAIAGDSDGFGNLDLTDGCLNVSVGLPVIFQPEPNANLSVGNTICEGDSILLNFVLTGMAPFNVFYEIGPTGATQIESFSTANTNEVVFYTPPTGTSEVTVILNRVESQGCETTVSGTQTIRVNPPALNEINNTLCATQTFPFMGMTYDINNPSDTIILPRGAVGGCDSLIYIDLQFDNAASSLIDTTLCSDDFIRVRGNRYDMATPMGQETFPGALCDSIVDINLSFFAPINEPFRDTFCLTDTITINGTIYDQFNTSGTEVLIAANTCDSTVMVDLFFENELRTPINDTLCFGGFLDIQGERFDASRPTGQIMLQTNSGCDSLLVIDLSFRDEIKVPFKDTLCFGGFIEIQGERFDSNRPSGQVTFQTSSGCDSLLEIELDFRDELVSTFRDTICSGETIQVGNETFDESRLNGVVVFDADGCDSTVTVDLTLENLEVSLSGNQNICPGDTAVLIVNISLSNSVFIRLDDGTEFNNVTDGFQIKVAPSQTTQYAIASIIDNSGSPCLATLNGSPVTVTVGSLQVDTQLSDYNGVNITCLSANDGSIELLPQNGTPPFTVIWTDNGSNDLLRTDLPQGDYEVSVIDAAGCGDTLLISLTEPDAITFDFDVADPDCQNGITTEGSIELFDIMGGVGPFEVSLDGIPQLGATPLVIDNLPQGTYELIIKDENDCFTTEEITLTASSPLSVSLGADTTINLGGSVTLVPIADFTATNYEWTPSDFLDCGDCPNPVANPTSDITYSVMAFDTSGCFATDDIFIRVIQLEEEETQVFVPTAFSPDNNGINDFFYVYTDGNAINISKFFVFDRWGNEVFGTTDLPVNEETNGWDGMYRGKFVNSGVYVYFVEIEFIDGSKEIFKGDITVTR